MTDPDDVQPSRGKFSWIRRIFRPERPERMVRPVQPPIVVPERDHDRETTRVQLEVIQRAFDGLVGMTGEDDDPILFHREQVLVRREQREELDNFFRESQDDYRGLGDVMDEPIEGLNVYRLPPRLAEGEADVIKTLVDLERSGRPNLATPDHVLYVTPGTGRLCPYTEPDLPPSTRPVPARSADAGAGKGVRVSVVDTGWYAAAAIDSDTTWLAAGVEGEDDPGINGGTIGPYAGHGTFVTGVLRCMAPAVAVENEAILIKGGAALESEIVKQLHDAMVDRDKPDLISISAGTHTYGGAPLLSFVAFSAIYNFTEGDDAVLVVAAAGNDNSSAEFWPAAFPWVLSVGSLDADGKKSKFSNYGKWVDVWAQGSNLVNAFPTGTYTTYEPQTPAGQVRNFTGLAMWSGTSFATPIVTGAIAAYMTKHNVKARAARDALKAAAPTKQDPDAGTMKSLGPPFM